MLPVESERRSEGDADEHFEVVRKPGDEREELLSHPALLILVLARPLQEREEIHGFFAQDTRFPNVRHPWTAMVISTQCCGKGRREDEATHP